MVTIENILVPTDLSEPAARAIPFAVEFARVYDADLHVIHVVEEQLYADLLYGEGILNPGAAFETLVENRRKMMEPYLRAIPEGVRTHVHLRRGIVACEIVAAARDLKSDLIVIATHGRTGLAHLLLGSVAERVVRESPCPVLAVREKGSKEKAIK